MVSFGYEASHQAGINMEIEIEAAARILAIKYGAVELGELIEWADLQILKEASPHSNLIDLSLAKTLGEAVSALNKFETPKDCAAVAKLAFRFFHQSLLSGAGNYQTIAKGLYDMALEGFMPKPESEGAMLSFWDSIDLAIDGVFGDPEEEKRGMLKFLENTKD